MEKDQIVIVDYGSQYTQLLARRVLEIGVSCVVVAPEADLSSTLNKRRGVILSGSPESARFATPDMTKWVNGPLPVLGICFGLHLMCNAVGGVIERTENKAGMEFGPSMVSKVTQTTSKLFQNIPDSFQCWMSHAEYVESVPDGLTITHFSSSDIGKVPAIIECIPPNGENMPYRGGVQFHPEVTQTEHGAVFLKNFVFEICKCNKDWDMGSVRKNLVDNIRKVVGPDDTVVHAISGGVDSTVCLALLLEALQKSQIRSVFVDHGMNRWEDSRHIQFLQNHYPIEVINVADEFQEALKNVTDAEEKRKIIGELFVRTFEKQSPYNHNNNLHTFDDVVTGKCWLAQGTIYPDIIESGGKRRASIKSHHNVGGLPRRMLGFQLLEPLKRLFKDEVRRLGDELGVPQECVLRHPFPGPGLAIRIMGDVTNERVRVLQKADDIFLSILRKRSLYDQVSQSFAVLLPNVNTVGLRGDARVFGPVIALRCVNTVDFMTANWSYLPYEALAEASREITNQIPNISRVVYDITTKPPSTIEWE